LHAALLIECPNGGHVDVLTHYKETVAENHLKFYIVTAIMSLVC